VECKAYSSGVSPEDLSAFGGWYRGEICDSNSEAYFTGPTNLYPVKFFKKDSEANLTGATNPPQNRRASPSNSTNQMTPFESFVPFVVKK
jgi:hypothetical protein